MDNINICNGCGIEHYSCIDELSYDNSCYICSVEQLKLTQNKLQTLIKNKVMEKKKNLIDALELLSKKRFDEALDILEEYPRFCSEWLDREKLEGTKYAGLMDREYWLDEATDEQCNRFVGLWEIKSTIKWFKKHPKYRDKHMYRPTKEEIDFACGFAYDFIYNDIYNISQSITI